MTSLAEAKGGPQQAKKCGSFRPIPCGAHAKGWPERGQTSAQQVQGVGCAGARGSFLDAGVPPLRLLLPYPFVVFESLGGFGGNGDFHSVAQLAEGQKAVEAVLSFAGPFHLEYHAVSFIGQADAACGFVDLLTAGAAAFDGLFLNGRQLDAESLDARQQLFFFFGPDARAVRELHRFFQAPKGPVRGWSWVFPKPA